MSWPIRPRIEMRERLLDVRRAAGRRAIEASADEDPRPRAQHVVRDVEEQHRAERIPLRLRREHPLRDVAAAAGLGAGIPDRPPLHRDRHDEDRDGDVPVVREVRQDAQVVQCRRDPASPRACRSARDRPPTCGAVDREVGGGDDRRHLDEELDHVDDEHAPQAGVRGEHDVEHADRRAASASARGRTAPPRSCTRRGSPSP